MKLLFLILFAVCTLTNSAYGEETADKTAAPLPSIQYYLSDPIFDDKEITQWCKESLTTLFKLDSKDDQKTLEQNKNYFTGDGYQQFIDLLTQLNVTDTIEKDQIGVSAYFDNDPKLISKKIVKHQYEWHITTSVALLFKGDGEAFEQDADLKITLKRVLPNNSTGMGIAISEIGIVAKSDLE